jgi:hypothetical protein
MRSRLHIASWPQHTVLHGAPVQVRLGALKREEDALQRERETLEAAKLAHIKCDLCQMCTTC